jgi:RNA polymerase sigma factor (sigma-70 family)
MTRNVLWGESPGRTVPMSEISHDLIAAAADGDERALEALLARCHRLFHAVAYRTLSPSYPGWDLEDAMQCCRLALLECVGKFDLNGTGKFTTWITTCARTRCIVERRRYYRGWTLPKSTVPDYEMIGVGTDEWERCAAVTPAPEIAEEREPSEVALRARALLDEMEETLRRTLLLRYGLDDYGPRSLQEIGLEMGCRSQTVFSREKRGLRQLRALIEAGSAC